MEPLAKKPQGPLTRTEIAVLLSRLGAPGENQTEKQAAVHKLCLDRRTGVNATAHPIWEALDDFPEY